MALDSSLLLWNWMNHLLVSHSSFQFHTFNSEKNFPFQSIQLEYHPRNPLSRRWIGESDYSNCLTVVQKRHFCRLPFYLNPALKIKYLYKICRKNGDGFTGFGFFVIGRMWTDSVTNKHQTHQIFERLTCSNMVQSRSSKQTSTQWYSKVGSKSAKFT
jgi:hypothetical protein